MNERYRMASALLSFLVLALFVCGCNQGGIEPATGAGKMTQEGTEENLEGRLVVEEVLPLAILPGESLEGNLLSNAGFEEIDGEQVGSWEVSGGGFMADTGSVAEGLQSLKIISTEPVVFEQKIDRAGQFRYIAQSLVKVPEGAGGVTLELTALGEHLLGDKQSTSSPADRTGAWVLLQTELETSLFAEGIKLAVKYSGGSEDPVIIDDCRLHALTPPPNLLPNGDFSNAEILGHYWNDAKSFDSRVVSFNGPGALKQALLVSLKPQDNMGIYQVVDGLSSEKTYVFRGYIKTQDLVGKARLEVQHKPKGWKAFLKFTDGLSGATDWTWVELEFSPPADMKSGVFFLRRPTPKDGGAGKVWFANVELFEKP